MPTLFSVKEAAAITGASKQSIRSYTTIYPRWFSTEATPPQGKERKFTRDDLRLIRFIYTAIGRGNTTHDQVLQQLEQGDLDSFEWEAPEDAPGTMPESPQDASTYLVPVAQLQAAQALMLDAQAREQQAIQREQALQERIEQMQREMGKLEGALAAIKDRPRSWWARVFGGGE